MPKYILRSDCCKARTKRVRDWYVCKKCNKRCFIQKFSTDIRERSRFAK